MATKITNNSNFDSISSGIYQKENDLTIVQQQAGGFAGASIGLTEKGPAFEIINSATFPERKGRLGDLNPQFLTSYYAKQFLEQSRNYKEVRILGIEGYTNDEGYVIAYKGSSEATDLNKRTLPFNSLPGTQRKDFNELYLNPNSIFAVMKPRNPIDLGWVDSQGTQFIFITALIIDDVASTGSSSFALGNPYDDSFKIHIKLYNTVKQIESTISFVTSLRPESKDYILKKIWDKPFKLDSQNEKKFPLLGQQIIPIWVDYLVPSIQEKPTLESLKGYYLPDDKADKVVRIPLLAGNTLFTKNDAEEGTKLLVENRNGNTNNTYYVPFHIDPTVADKTLYFSYIFTSPIPNTTPAPEDPTSWVVGQTKIEFNFQGVAFDEVLNFKKFTLNSLEIENFNGTYPGSSVRWKFSVKKRNGQVLRNTELINATEPLELGSNFFRAKNSFSSPIINGNFEATEFTVTNASIEEIGFDFKQVYESETEIFIKDAYYIINQIDVNFDGTYNVTIDNPLQQDIPNLPYFNPILHLVQGSNVGMIYNYNLPESTLIGKLCYAGNFTFTITEATLTDFAQIEITLNASSNINYTYLPFYISKANTYSNRAFTFEVARDLDSQLWKQQFLNLEVPFQTPKTPWFVSDMDLDGNVKKLFRLQSISDGDAANTEIKVEISNLNSTANNGNGTFDLLIRRFEDTEDVTGKQVLETYSNLTMDKNSANYIVRKIGNGEDFPNKSKYIVLELNDSIELEDDLLPYGVEGYDVPEEDILVNYQWTTDYDNSKNISKQILGLANNSINGNKVLTAGTLKYFTGTTKTSKGFHLYPRLGNGLAPQGDFLEKFTIANGPLISVNPSGINYTQSEIRKRLKYCVGFCGGFDGWNVMRERTFNTYGSKDYDAYKIAVDLLSDNEILGSDFSVLVTPDIYFNSGQGGFMNELVKEMVEGRGDCLYIPDLEYNLASDPQEAVDALNSSEMRSSFTAVYHPWLQIEDNVNEINVWNPPSILALGTIAYVAENQDVWQPPGGVLKTVTNSLVQSRRRLKHPDREILKGGNINPITLFNGSGYEITEVRTTQEYFSALSFIHNRLLLGYAKKALNQVLRPLLLQLNNTISAEAFTNAVFPIFDRIKKNNGLEKFQIDVAQSSAIADRTTLRGSITIVPLYPIEKIEVEYNLVDNSFTFNEK